LLGLWCGVALAQTAALTGTVTNALDSAPIAGVRVTLSGSSGRQTVLTDGGGKFVFGGVPVGSYGLSAERTGYLGSNEQEQSGGTAFVSVEAQGKPSPITMRLTPSATLIGRVTDEAGLPIPDPNVQVIRRVVSNGRGRLMAAGQTRGDDIGAFRVPGLAAGRYLVCVDANASSYQRHRGLTYTTTCFPDVTDLSSAQWLNLGSGEERILEFHITPVHGVRVSGSVRNAGKGTSISIRRMDPPGFPRFSWQPVVWDEKTSSFEILAVTPGDYLITAGMYGASGPNLRAMRTILVGSEDVRDVRLMLKDGPYLSGTVRMGEVPASGQNQVYVGFDGDNRLLSIYANASGSFKQAITEPGDCFVAVLPPPGWSLQTITEGGIDIRDRKIPIGADAEPEPIEIVLGQGGGGTIEVSVQEVLSKVNAPVKLALLRHLSTENEWAPQGQPMVANSADALSLRNIPSGEYSLFAWPAAIEFEYLNPEVLEKYRSFKQTVWVRESDTTRVTVVPIPIEKSP
jgi:hypothetical protein